jgi:TaqI-like C-terminal specificity domain
MQYGPWLSQPREIGIFSRPRILLREITGQLPYALHFTHVAEQFLNNKSVLNILDFDDDESALKVLLGILNSSLMSYFYKHHAVKAGRTIFPKVVVKDLRQFPVPAAVKSARNTRMIQLVEAMLGTQEQLAAAASENDRVYYEAKAAGLDRQIDELTYDLYGLLPKERSLASGTLTDGAEKDGVSPHF